MLYSIGKNLADFALTAEGVNAVKETLKEVLKLKGQQMLSPQFRMRLPPQTQTTPGGGGGAAAAAATVVLRAHAFHNPYSDELEFVIGKLRVLETPLATPANSAAAAAAVGAVAASSAGTSAASASAIGGAGVGMQAYAHVSQPKHDFPSLADLSYAAGASGLDVPEEAAGAGGASGQDFYPEWPPTQTQAAAAAHLSAEQHPHFTSSLYGAAAPTAHDYAHPSQALGLPVYQPPFLPSPTHLDPPALANPYRLAPSQYLNAAGNNPLHSIP